MSDSKRIAELNDRFRTTLSPLLGKVVLTAPIQYLSETKPQEYAEVRAKIKQFKFEGVNGNNPYGENDFGKVEHNGIEYYFKIDYYDRNMEYCSEDPADEYLTVRVLLIGELDEY